MEISDEAKKKIADAVADFLRTRMRITQRVFENRGFMVSMKAYLERYSELEDNPNAFSSFYRQFSNRIAISDEEIEELVELVRESLIKYGHKHCASSGAFHFFISDALRDMKKGIKEDNALDDTTKALKIQKIEDWEKIYSWQQHFGIDERIGGSYSWKYYDEFSIRDSQKALVAKIGFDGTDLMQQEGQERDEENEDILISGNVFTGVFYEQQGGELQECPAVFLLKNVNGEEVAKVIYPHSNYGEMLPLDKQPDNLPYACFGDNINDFLEDKGLAYFVKDLYDMDSLWTPLRIFQVQSSLSEEEKEKIEKVIDFVIQYWEGIINNCKHSRILKSHDPTSSEWNTFRDNLRMLIRSGILLIPNSGRTVYELTDGDVEFELKRAGLLNARDYYYFSYGTPSTYITSENVKIYEHNEENVIYSSSQNMK